MVERWRDSTIVQCMWCRGGEAVQLYSTCGVEVERQYFSTVQVLERWRDSAIQGVQCRWCRAGETAQ